MGEVKRSWSANEDRVTSMSKNIIIIGMRGSGKTVVAALLARRLGRRSLDSYKALSQTYFSSVADMIVKRGWEYFRNREANVIERLVRIPDVVISTGSGVVLRPDNIKNLKRNGICVLLTASVDTLLRRHGQNPILPSLSKEPTLREELEHSWRDRKALYEATADVTVDTEGKSPDDIADEIAHILEDRYGIPIVREKGDVAASGEVLTWRGAPPGS